MFYMFRLGFSLNEKNLDSFWYSITLQTGVRNFTVVLLPSQVEVLAISLLSFAVIKVPVLLFYGLVFVRQKVFLT